MFMKTFEERYTAWIDGQLDGPAQASFEQELARRSAAGEARADRTEAKRLHRLLTTHLQAPALTNADFFSHQLRGRIEADRAATRRREEARRAVSEPWYGWSLARCAGVGASAVFVSAALYYGLVPEGRSTANQVVQTHQVPAVVPSPKPAMETVPVPGPGKSLNDGQLVLLTTPVPSLTTDPVITASADLRDVQVAEPSAKTTTATPLHYQAPNVNVLWINGLDYQPNVPGDNPPAPPAATTAP